MWGLESKQVCSHCDKSISDASLRRDEIFERNSIEISHTLTLKGTEMGNLYLSKRFRTHQLKFLTMSLIHINVSFLFRSFIIIRLHKKGAFAPPCTWNFQIQVILPNFAPLRLKFGPFFIINALCPPGFKPLRKRCYG